MRKALVFTAMMMLLLLTACGGTSSEAENEPAITPEAELIIEASDYQFNQSEYHLKKDVPVKIIFKNVQGHHGVLIPGLNVQLDSRKDSKVIIPTKAGEYEISCSIMCGSGHSTMISKIIVE